MSFRAELDGQTLFDTARTDLGISAGQVTLRLDGADAAEFTLPADHPGQSLIGGGTQRITIYRVPRAGEEEILFCGRPRQTELDLYGNMTVTAQGMLAALEDAEFPVEEGAWTRDESAVRALIDMCAQVCGESFPLRCGRVDALAGAGVTIAAGTMTGLKLLQTLAQAMGGRYFVRCEEDGPYLDWLFEESLPLCAQQVRAGENLLQLSYAVSAPEMTVLYPTAKDASGQLLTIGSVSPDGRNILRDDAAVTRHGLRYRAQDFGTLDSAYSLYVTASETFAAQSADSCSVSAQAVDLTDAGTDTQPFRVGQRVRVTVPRLGIDVTAPIVSQTISLCDVSKNRVTVGASRAVITA